MNAGVDGDDFAQRRQLIVPKLFPFGGMSRGEIGRRVRSQENDGVGRDLAQSMLDEKAGQWIPGTL